MVLEMIGDLPDADMKPPENVLFVCKPNPVTTDDDLEIIFTRCAIKYMRFFGAVRSYGGHGRSDERSAASVLAATSD